MKKQPNFRFARSGKSNSILFRLLAACLAISLVAAACGSDEETAEPMEETAEPMEETAEPMEETAEPMEETAEPMEETAEPMEETAEPMEETAEPMEETAEPMEETAEPMEETAEPMEETAEPMEETAEPMEETAEPMGELLVGYMLPSTGALAFLNEPMIKGVELARDEINAAGGDVRLIAGDSGSSADVASATADDLLADGVSAIVGAAASGVSLSVIDKITDAGVILFSPSNTSPSFTTYDDGGFYFRSAPSDLLQAQVLGDLVTDQGVTETGILYRADDYGKNLAEALEARLTDNGVGSVSIAYDPEGSSFDAEIQQILRDGVNGIVLIAFEEGGNIIAGMIEAGIGPSEVPLFMGDGTASGNLWKLVDPENPAVLVGALATSPSAAPSDGEPTFPERFAAYAGTDVETIFSSHSYDALVVLALASMVAGSTEAADYVGEINDVTRGGTKCTSFAACSDLIADGEDIDYDGASGPLDFSEPGEPSAGSYDISEFTSDGSLSSIAEVFIDS